MLEGLSHALLVIRNNMKDFITRSLAGCSVILVGTGMACEHIEF
jgi:hypothetical protein